MPRQAQRQRHSLRKTMTKRQNRESETKRKIYKQRIQIK